MSKRETPWEALITCILPIVVTGMALFSAPWGVMLTFLVIACPSCGALVYVLVLHQQLVDQVKKDTDQLCDMIPELEAERRKVAELTSRLQMQSPPTQQAERDAIVLGVVESVKAHAAMKAATVAAPIPATKPAPVAAPVPATKPAPVMVILDEPVPTPTPKEAPPKIQAAPSADLDGAKYLPPSGNQPKTKFLHCDQTIPAAYPKALRGSGFNCSQTKGHDVTEEAQLDMAHEEGRVLVSTNVDFEILAAHGRKHAGILIIPRDAKAETILGACRAIWSKVRKSEGGGL